MIRKATISECGTYRVALSREYDPTCVNCTDARKWPGGPPRKSGFVSWVLNNPSTADGINDDPTVRKAWKYTRGWGYGAMLFVNTNCYRSTHPELALYPSDYVMMQNDGWLRHAMDISALTICGWGDRANDALAKHAFEIMHELGPLHAMRITKDGNPQHPLYLASTCEPNLWKGEKYQS